MIAARRKVWYEEMAKERQAAAGGDKVSERARALDANLRQALDDPSTRSNAKAGADVGVSARSVGCLAPGRSIRRSLMFLGSTLKSCRTVTVWPWSAPVYRDEKSCCCAKSSLMFLLCTVKSCRAKAASE